MAHDIKGHAWPSRMAHEMDQWENLVLNLHTSPLHPHLAPAFLLANPPSTGFSSHYRKRSRCRRAEAVGIGLFGRRHSLCRWLPSAQPSLSTDHLAVGIATAIGTAPRWAQRWPNDR
jgi:hypothetical protein